MLRVMKSIDKANGYVFGDLDERNIQSLMSCAVGAEFEYEKISRVQEKYMDIKDDDDDQSDIKTWNLNLAEFFLLDIILNVIA